MTAIQSNPSEREPQSSAHPQEIKLTLTAAESAPALPEAQSGIQLKICTILLTPMRLMMQEVVC
jgi:hypothetical protein